MQPYDPVLLRVAVVLLENKLLPQSDNAYEIDSQRVDWQGWAHHR